MSSAQQRKSNKDVSLAKYWEGINTSLQAKLESVKEYLKHPVTGFTTEEYFRSLLKNYIPKRYTIDTGFVVDSKGKSNFIDIIIADTLNIPRLCYEPNYSIFAIESVCAVIEVTTSPKARVDFGGKKIPKFESDILKLAKVRKMGHSRRYFDFFHYESKNEFKIEERSFPVILCPRSFIITCGDEWKKPERYKKNIIDSLKKVKEEYSDTWINAAFSLTHGMLHFKPYTEFENEWIKNNSLLEFVLLINNALSTFPTWRIDISKYRPIPELEKLEKNE